MHNKVFVISFKVAYDENPSLNDKEYFESYEYFLGICRSNDIDCYIVFEKDYLVDNKFSCGWKLMNGQGAKVPGVISADLIYTKDPLDTKGKALVVNDFDLHKLCSDKWLTYQEFSRFMSPTVLINDSNIENVLDGIKTEQIVVKPRTGAGGEDVHILSRNIFSNDVNSGKFNNYIAQGFLDSSKGIPGIVDGLHDLRILMFNNEPKLAYIREPKKGGLLANVSQGGTMTLISILDLPETVFTVCGEVDKVLSKYGSRFYSIDFMYSEDKPYIVELNSMPGFPYKSEGNFYDYHKFLFDFLIGALESTR